MANERRHTVMAGATLSEWFLVSTFIIGGFTTYFTVAATAGTAEKRSIKNELSITASNENMQKEIKESEARVKQELKQEIGVVREDIRELRKLIINNNVAHK